MKRLSFSCAMLFFAASAPATPDAEPSARELHLAQCVAALDVNTQRLAQEVKAGRVQARALLQARLEAGTAFIGDAYLHSGQSEAKAKALAAKALEDQKSLSEGELAARQTACADEGTALFKSGNALERVIVRRLAKSRMQKLLGS